MLGMDFSRSLDQRPNSVVATGYGYSCKSSATTLLRSGRPGDPSYIAPKISTKSALNLLGFFIFQTCKPLCVSIVANNVPCTACHRSNFVFNLLKYTYFGNCWNSSGRCTRYCPSDNVVNVLDSFPDYINRPVIQGIAVARSSPSRICLPVFVCVNVDGRRS